MSSTLIFADPFKATARRHYDKDPLDFGDEVLEVIGDLPELDPERVCNGTRWLDLGDAYLVLDRLEVKATPREHWIGAFMRVQHEEIPMLAGRDGTESMDDYIRDDHGIATHCAFVLDTEKQVLWLQRERSVAGKTLVGDYFRTKSGLTVNLMQMFREDAVKRALKFKTIRTVEFAYLAGEGTGQGWSKVFRKFEEYGAARIEVRITPTRGGELDDPSRVLVKEIAEEVESGSGAITKAKIKGRYSDDDEELIDLLHDRGAFSQSIETARLRDPKRLMNAVRSIWLKYRDTL